MSSLAVAIISYNTRDFLRACLSSVIREAPREIVVVDNASSDGSAAMVTAEYPQVLLQINETNGGYGAAANQAIARCQSDYVVLMNADTLLPPNALTVFEQYLTEHPRAGVVGPRLVEADGTLQASCYPFPKPLGTLLENSRFAVFLGRRIRRYAPVVRDLYLRTWAHDSPRKVPWIKGAVLAIRRAAFDAVGGFDPAYFMYFEDADLCYRLHAAGWETHFTPHTTAVHIGGASTRQCQAEMSARLLTSTLRFYQTHASRAELAKVFLIIKILIFGRGLTAAARFHLTRDKSKRYETESLAAAYRQVLSGQRTRSESAHSS